MFSSAGSTLTHIGGRYSPGMKLRNIVSCHHPKLPRATNERRRRSLALGANSQSETREQQRNLGYSRCSIEEDKPGGDGKKWQEELSGNG
jgi:hypothetical protein